MTQARLLSSATLSLALLAAPSLAAAAPPTATIDLGGGVSLELVLVPRGSFTQGSPPAEKDRKDDERPRKVTISREFYLGKYPVTRGQWSRFAAASGYRSEAEKGSSGGSGFDGKELVQRKEFTWKNPGFPQDDRHPITLVTWDDARAFNDWLSRVSGRDISLPSEAQWEHAYRAGSATAFYEGNDPLALGWFKENALGGTHPVGQKKANRFGLHDMGGNVFEWCADWYAPYGPDAVDPLQTVADTTDKARRVLRGGSWFKEARSGRAAARNRNTPGSRNADNGFRVMAGLEARAPQIPAESSPPSTPPGTPPPASPKPGSSKLDAETGLGLGVIFGGGCCGTGGFLALIYWLATRGSSVRGIRFQPGHDGFWVLAPSGLTGSTLNYRYTAGGSVLMGNVVLEPGPNGQFVYTGATPSNMQAVNVVSSRRVQQQPYRGGGRSTPHHHTHEEPDRSFRGFPPAY